LKLILYDDNNKVKQVIEDVTEPSFEGKNVKWRNNAMQGIKLNFILVDDIEEIGETVTDDNIAADQKEDFKKVDQLAEIKKLKSQNAEIIFKLVMNGIM
jgi:hypothetical protein